MIQKRFQYWGAENGKPIKLWSEWFPYNGPQEPQQLGKGLKNEYREV